MSWAFPVMPLAVSRRWVETFLWVGGWVGGWLSYSRKVGEEQAVRMRCWTLGVEWVGG